MPGFAAVVGKLVYLILLICAGIGVRKRGLLSDKGRQDASRLLVDVFWPALIFSSITGQLRFDDLIAGALLPILAAVTALTGLVLGAAVLHFNRFSECDKRVFLYDATINNFVFLVLPFVIVMIPDRGKGMLFLHNLGFLVVLWTLGISILRGGLNVRDRLRHLFSPGLVATLAGCLFVICGLVQWIPSPVEKAVAVLGRPTIPVAMIIAGSQIYDLGLRSAKLDRWNVQLFVVRMLLVPGLLLPAAYGLVALGVSREVILIFLLVNIMPVSINSVSLALRFDASAERAAQAVVTTHLAALLTIPAFVYLFQMLFYNGF